MTKPEIPSCSPLDHGCPQDYAAWVSEAGEEVPITPAMVALACARLLGAQPGAETDDGIEALDRV